METKPNKTYRELVNEQVGRQKALRFGQKTNKENIPSNGDSKSNGYKFTKIVNSITNSNNINVRKNYGSNDSHTYAAPKKYGLANKFERSKEKTVQGLRKNSSKATCTYQALKSTINNFSNLAKYSNHM